MRDVDFMSPTPAIFWHRLYGDRFVRMVGNRPVVWGKTRIPRVRR